MFYELLCCESTHWRIPLQTTSSAKLCCLIGWWNVDAWLKVSTLLAQCVVSPFVPILITTESKLWFKSSFLSCLSKRAVEQTVDMQVSRQFMKLRLCYCYVICHSVIDDIIVPVCTGHQWIPVARDHWGWTLAVQYAAIPLLVDSSHKLDVFFYVCLNKLFNKQ